MRKRSEKGQAILLVVAAMGIFLVGALGLAIDGAQLYGQRGMAQVAADAAAQAAILSIFNGTNVGTNAFAATTGYTHTCTTTDTITPCAHARKNKFGGTAADTVYIDVPTATSVGLDPASLSSDPINLIRVSVTRSVGNGIIRLLGAAATTPVTAVAVAAIVSVQSPTPLLITHPNLANSLSTNGNTNIIICGGPTRSVQVNSVDPAAYASPKAGGTVNLSNAGPPDTGNCLTGTGADFGVYGGSATNPGSVSLGTTGHYVSPSSPVQDPLRNVPAPGETGGPAIPTTAGSSAAIANGIDGCTNAGGCVEYSPGLYVGGLNASGGNPVIFKPGLYYMRGGGFTLKNVNGGGGLANNWNAMSTNAAQADTNTGMGMVVYDTGNCGATVCALNSNSTGGFVIDTNVQASLQGATLTTTNAAGNVVPATPYYGILFWEDRNADKHVGSGPTSNHNAHSIGQGNGCFSLIGTIYITNWLSVMTSDLTHYQEVDYNGNPCSTTYNQGDIIISSLQIVGSTTIRMKLVPYGFLNIRQIALVR
jgi:hypothetical protein